MTSIGERLRRARLEKNIRLDFIARETKIGVRLLQAIEAEEFDKLPGGVFRKSFVLQYARFLGLDAEGIAAELQHVSGFEEVPNIPGQELPRFGSDMPAITPSRDWTGARNSLVALGAVVAVVMGCAGLYALWLRLDLSSSAQSKAPATASARPEAAPASTPAGPAGLTPATSSAAPPAPASGLPVSSGTADVAGKPAATPATTAGMTPAPAAAEAGQPASGASPVHPTPEISQPVRVDLSAGESTWVQIVSDGKRVFSEVLRPHETKVVQASERVRLVIGNAGGLDVSLNGKSIGPIGPRGQVRVIDLTPAGFQIIQRKPPTEPL
jgi:cytoskeleton protein RodZ